MGKKNGGIIYQSLTWSMEEPGAKYALMSREPSLCKDDWIIIKYICTYTYDVYSKQHGFTLYIHPEGTCVSPNDLRALPGKTAIIMPRLFLLHARYRHSLISLPPEVPTF